MGKTERASSHWAWREPSDFGGAGKFKVVMSLFTVASSIRKGHPEIERPPLCCLRDTAKRSPQPLPDVLLPLGPAGHDRQTPGQALTRRWQIPSCHTRPLSLPLL